MAGIVHGLEIRGAMTYAVTKKNHVIYGRDQAIGLTPCYFVGNRTFFVVAGRGGCWQLTWGPHGPQPSTFRMLQKRRCDKLHDLHSVGVFVPPKLKHVVFVGSLAVITMRAVDRFGCFPVFFELTKGEFISCGSCCVSCIVVR